MNRAAIGLRKHYEVDVLARRYRPRFAAFFRKQKGITLERFKDYKFLFTEEYRNLREEIHPNELLTTHDWDRLWQEVDRETFDALQKIIAGVEGEGVLKGAAFSANQIGTITPDSPTFSLANPRAVSFFQKTGGDLQYIRNIQDETRDQIQTMITKAISGGWGYTRTAKEMSNTFDGMSRERARSIAVHESALAYESGSFMFEQDLQSEGIDLEKHWQDSGDDRVSEGCLENTAAGWIPLDQPFPSGHMYPPRFPGRGGSGGCRCYHIVRQASKS